MIRFLKRNRNYRLFWFSTGISGIGDYVDDIAIAMLIYQITGSTLLTSYVFAIKIVLSFVSIATSAITDYLNKKMVLIITSYGQGVLLMLLLWLYYEKYLSVVALFVFVTIQTVFSTFCIPAQNALIPLLISDDEIMLARASSGFAQQLIRVFAYLGAGSIIASMGVTGAIAIDAVTFFVAGTLLFWIKYEEINSVVIQKQFSFISSLKGGMHTIYSNKKIWIVILVTFWGNFFTSPLDSLAVVYFENFFSNTTLFSYFMAAIALGSLAGTYSMVRIGKKKQVNRIFASGFFAGGLALALLYYTAISIVPIIAGGLYGLSNGIVSVLNGVILQKNTPKEEMGRVFSVFKNLTFISGPIGVVFAGYLSESIGLNLVFLLMGAGIFITALIAYKYT